MVIGVLGIFFLDLMVLLMFLVVLVVSDGSSGSCYFLVGIGSFCSEVLVLCCLWWFLVIHVDSWLFLEVLYGPW